MHTSINAAILSLDMVADLCSGPLFHPLCCKKKEKRSRERPPGTPGGQERVEEVVGVVREVVDLWRTSPVFSPPSLSSSRYLSATSCAYLFSSLFFVDLPICHFSTWFILLFLPEMHDILFRSRCFHFSKR